MILNKKKIINDPVYGFIKIPYDILYDIIEEPYFQRLRRIKQLGLTHYVYPGALHTRFHHALGAMYLMTESIRVLRSKGVKITNKEAKAVTLAILLHDIGHGPFSHALENKLIDIHHENLSLGYMKLLNKKYKGELDLAIKLFKGKYKKKFLCQLISSQLDMDRLDYLTRDSFYSGVLEGRVGYDRIIKMLNVYQDNLVVEEKGIYSVENLLIARRFMYLQVYLHKAVISAEQMLAKVIERARELVEMDVNYLNSSPLHLFLSNKYKKYKRKDVFREFSQLDDSDIISSLKVFTKSDDPVIVNLSRMLLNRELLKLNYLEDGMKVPYNFKIFDSLKKEGVEPLETKKYFYFKGKETSKNYELNNEILILSRHGKVRKLSSFGSLFLTTKATTISFYCCPKWNSGNYGFKK